MMAPAPLALVLAGGTGGHVYPALAVAAELRDRGFRLGWVGTRQGLEARVVPAADIDLHTLPMRGIRGKGLLRQLLALGLLGISLLRSLVLVLQLRPAVVIGMGGYASFPAAVAAWLLRRPLVLQEQNAVAGSANRSLARFAKCIATGFPGVLSQYPVARYLGNPVRADLLDVGAPAVREPSAPLRILVLGGSLGARPLNEQLPAVAGRLAACCEWRHQCGRAHEESTRSAYETDAAGASWSVEPFLEDMAGAYRWADLVICRAGALTVAELAVTGRASILVPLPYAIDDHQRANARFLSEAGAAILIEQEQLAETLEAELLALHEDPERLRDMGDRARACARPEATREIADCCEALKR